MYFASNLDNITFNDFPRIERYLIPLQKLEKHNYAKIYMSKSMTTNVLQMIMLDLIMRTQQTCF